MMGNMETKNELPWGHSMTAVLTLRRKYAACSHKQKMWLWFGIATLLSGVGFALLFQGFINPFVALGLSLLAFTGFYFSFEKAFFHWDALKGAPPKNRS